MEGVYRPAEDTLLLLRHAEERVEGSVLEVGTGSGVIAVAMALKPDVSRVVATDINPAAIEAAAGRAREAGVAERIEFKVCDLFEGVEGRFDWILFNPPYLPSEGPTDEPSWSGGNKGYETTLRFLEEAAGHLKEDGRILLISSSQTGLRRDELERIYSVEVLEELPLFYERLYCLLFSPLSPSGSPGRSRR